jgi:alpha-glucosidase
MKTRLAALPIAVALVAAAAAPAQAGWSSLGRMPAPERQGQSLLFRNEQGSVQVAAVAPGVVRVRFVAAQAFGRDHSYAVLDLLARDSGARIETGAARSVVHTGGVQAAITHDPFRIAFATADGASLDEDDPARGIGFVDKAVRVWKRLRPDEHVYGLGEKTGPLDKRGPYGGGSYYAMWNSDTYAYDDATDPIYVSVPFYMVVRKGRAHGLFLDNTFRSSFDIGKESEGRISFGAEDGELSYYFIDGPTPKDVLQRYTALTGRMPLPPRWALGYHQCRYSYYPEARVRWIADTFRLKKIPADVIWLDIHYLEGYNPFTWDRERFPDPPRMIADLGRQGFRVVTILDPHPKAQKGWDVYDTGLLGDHFVKNPDGSPYVAPVWPSNAEKNPGPSVFPDFSKPGAREWWGGLYRKLTDVGVAGIWNDMNEPAVFETPGHTMPMEVRHDNEGQPTDHREVHNVYGQQMTRSTYEGLLRLRPERRPFILTRASYAGGQRWAAMWPGDNVSSWAHLRASVPVLLGMGLSGMPFVGSDIGGFAEAPTAELYTRWLQLGTFYPFMRTHTTFGTPDQEPWSYGPRHEEINRRAIELRYELLPYIYSVMRETSETGVPAMRPLMLEFPQDERTYGSNEEFLFGSSLLVAPVLREAVNEHGVYLPPGEWFDYWTGKRYQGGRNYAMPVTLESVPLFVRAGAFLFRQPVVQHTGEMAGQPLRVTAYPGPGAPAVLYEDEGEGFAYRDGGFARRTFTQARDGRTVRIDVSASEGRWRPQARPLLVEVVGEPAPARVLVDGRALARAEESALGAATEGWTVAGDGTVRVKVEDRAQAIAITMEPGGM